MKESKLHKLVDKRFKHDFQDAPPTFGEKMADKLAKFGGSWAFVLCFSLSCLGWIIFNLHFYTFDAFPFILLNLFLSCLAAIQAPIILMSNNRMSQVDRARDELSYKINLENDIQINDIHEKLDKIVNYIDSL